MGASKISHDVWMVDQRWVNAFFIAADEPIVVDAGLSGRVTDLISQMSEAGVDPGSVRHIAVTHYHVDHTGGLSRLQTLAPDAVTSMHAHDAPVVRGEAPQPGPTVGGLKGIVAKQVGRRLFGKAPVAKVDREISDGDYVCEGLRAIHTPGHTGGHMVFLWEPDRVLFIGDAAANLRGLGPPPMVFTEDPALTRESYRLISELDFDVAVFGHGKPITERAVEEFKAFADREAAKATV